MIARGVRVAEHPETRLNDPAKGSTVLTRNNDRKDDFGYREALTEVIAQLAVA